MSVLDRPSSPTSNTSPRTAAFRVVARVLTAVLLALLLLPLGGSSALLPSVLGALLDPLVRAVSGG